MKIIRHNFSKEAKAFGIIQPRMLINPVEKFSQYKVVSAKNPNDFCIVNIIEIMFFNLDGDYNKFDNWFSYILFGLPAATIIELVKKKYPANKEEFEIWIALKTQ